MMHRMRMELMYCKPGTGFRKGAGSSIYRRKVTMFHGQIQKSAFILFMSLILTVILFCAAMNPIHAFAAGRLQETGESPIIVIDPGHGGENRGTIENNHEEKSMTMITAQAMYDELCLYDNVEVYLTRTDDRDLSLKERAQYAADKNADFLFSLHYNASENHELFGTEVWISAFAPYNGYGYQFGHEFLTDMREKGLFVRGVKTRYNDKKDADYYGIIRESVALEIPAVIIEHCHVDEERDEGYCETEEQLKEFGRADATAVAKYFGLKSSTLGVDYSSLQLADASLTSVLPITLKDSSEPDICQITFADADYEKGILSLTVNAADYDSPLLYYDYSLDGGITYSRREIWPDCDALTGTYSDTFTLNLQIPTDTKPQVIVRAYNMFDLFLKSNCYLSPDIFSGNREPLSEEPTDNTGAPDVSKNSLTKKEVTDAVSDQTKEIKEVSILTFLEICLVIVVLLFIILLVSQTIAYRKKKKRRFQSRNDVGNKRNHPR